MTLVDRISALIDQIDELEKERPEDEEFQSALGLAETGLCEALGIVLNTGVRQLNDNHDV